MARNGLAGRLCRAIGVSRMAICKALQAGRLQPYDEAGRPVSPDFQGRNF